MPHHIPQGSRVWQGLLQFNTTQLALVISANCKGPQQGVQLQQTRTKLSKTHNSTIKRFYLCMRSIKKSYTRLGCMPVKVGFIHNANAFSAFGVTSSSKIMPLSKRPCRLNIAASDSPIPRSNLQYSTGALGCSRESPSVNALSSGVTGHSEVLGLETSSISRPSP